MKSVYFLQRAIAYFIDMLLISIIGAIIGSFLIFRTDSYNEAVKKISEIPSSVLNGEIENEKDLDEYKKYSYIVQKSSGVSTVVQLVISVFYFGTFAYYNGGKTIGKKCMKIKVVSVDDNELSHGKFIIRAALITGVVTSLLSLLSLLLTDYYKYYNYDMLFTSINSLFIIACIIMIIFRKDKRGLHDLVVNSKIISTFKD